MKKLYTILGAALAGTMMVSAAVNANQFQTQMGTYKTISIEGAQISDKSFKEIKKDLQLKDNVIADEYELPAIEGAYIFQGVFDNEDRVMPMSISKNPDVADGYFINGFMFSDADPLPVKYGVFPFQISATQTEDMIAIQLQTNGATPLFTDEQGNVYSLYVAAYQNGSLGFYPDETIEFVMLNDGSFILPYEGVGLAWLNQRNGGYYGSAVMDVEFTAPSGLMQVSENSTDGTPVWETIQYPLIANYIAEDGIDYLSINGMGGYFNTPMDFVVDVANKAITLNSEGQPVTSFSTQAGQSYNAYFVTTSPAEIWGLTGTIANIGEGLCRIAIEGEWMLYIEDMGWYTQYKDAMMVVAAEIPGLPVEEGGDSGIADTIVDNNANAPVEYFNLQGVRVENPTSGLYIRRQGTNVSKVLVK